jgi:polysaccharide export outer membrane protein
LEIAVAQKRIIHLHALSYPKRMSEEKSMQTHFRKIIGQFDPEKVIKPSGNIAISATLAIASVLGSCVYPASGPLPDQAVAPVQTTLTAGDVIRFAFPGAPELNQSQKIRADGKINLPLIGEVDAAGKTIGNLQAEIALRYKPQLQNTTVVLTLESSVIQVIISGAVSKPAKLVFEQQTTVVQAIMEAGGPSEFGSLRRVHLIRKINGVEYTQVLDLSGITRGEPIKPYYVRNGDVIYIPQSPF